MATSAKPLTSSTTLTPAGGKPKFTVKGSTEIITAIVQDKSFPDQPLDVTVGDLNVQAQVAGNKTFSMTGIGSAPVTFNASGSTYAGLAAYQTPSKLVADLGFQSADGKLLNVDFTGHPNASSSRYMVVRWGFDVSGSASGKMALNPAVNLNFGASGSAEGLFAYVLQVDKAETAGKAFVDLLNAWCTPGDVSNNSAALPSGAWIVTEVTGQISANLGITAGYDFNWVKKNVRLNQLDGDIGLRISLGIAATLSVQLGGKYYLVVSRDTPTSGVRVRLFRATTRGWGFALNSGASVTPSTGKLAPDKVNDFIKGILGISDPQLLAFLNAANLDDVVNALGDGFLKALRLDGDKTKAFDDVKNVLKTWDALPNEVTSVIWKAAAKEPDLALLQNAAKQISTMSEASIASLLDSWLHDPAYLNNPICQWLEAATAKSLFELYESNQLQDLRNKATALAGLLDGATLQDTLTKLQKQVNTYLDLPTLETALNSGSIAGVARWIVQRLSTFLGVDLSSVEAEIAKINAAIKTIRDKAQEIYAATLKALNTTYGFSVDYAYTLSTTQSALIDVVFSDSARALLSDALRGDFTQILAVPPGGAPIPGVTLNNGTLTHGIERHAHVETHLPWWTGVADDLAKGYATANLVDSQNGRVQFFEAGATDTDSYKSAANVKRFASCSVGISGRAEGVRAYNLSMVDFGYSLVTSEAATTRSQFEYDFAPSVDQYFPNIFGDDSSDSTHAAFESWVVDWDKYTDQSPSSTFGEGVIGNTWTRLQVQSRLSSGGGWVAALLDGTMTPDYMAMARAMQESIRKYLLASYSSDPSSFKNLPDDNLISAFLVYTALPPLNDVTYDGRTLAPNPSGDIMWDVTDPTLTGAVTKAFVMHRLQANLYSVQRLLSGIAKLKNTAQYYGGREQRILGYVMQHLYDTSTTTSAGWLYLKLLLNEKTVVDGAKAAFCDLASAGAKELQQSLPTLAAALTNLVSNFNHALTALSINAPEVMQGFAPLVFQQAVKAMFPKIQLANDAMLDVAVLKPSQLVGADQEPTDDQVQLRHRITNFS